MRFGPLLAFSVLEAPKKTQDVEEPYLIYSILWPKQDYKTSRFFFFFFFSSMLWKNGFPVFSFIKHFWPDFPSLRSICFFGSYLTQHLKILFINYNLEYKGLNWPHKKWKKNQVKRFLICKYNWRRDKTLLFLNVTYWEYMQTISRNA